MFTNVLEIYFWRQFITASLAFFSVHKSVAGYARDFSVVLRKSSPYGFILLLSLLTVVQYSKFLQYFCWDPFAATRWSADKFLLCTNLGQLFHVFEALWLSLTRFVH